MRNAITMYKNLLVLITLGLCACGQQAGSNQKQSTGPHPQTHATGTSQKGQIVQPAVKPGKNADASSLLISFHGCADLLLIDPRGRKLGYDTASRKNYLDIPGGIYDEGDSSSDDEDDAKQQEQEKTARKQPDCAADKTVQFPQPIPGMYTLKMGGHQAAFQLEITSYGPNANANGHSLLSQPAGTAPLSYQFQLPPAPGAGLQVKTIWK